MQIRTVLGALTALALFTSPVAAQGQQPFSADERAQLLRGEMVRRDVSRSENGASLFGGASWMRVDAPLERVWALITSPSSYPRLIPSLESVRVVERVEGETVMAMHHAFGIGDADYFARMRVDEPTRTISFELDTERPRDVQSGRGFITLSPFRGGTIVAWGMLADVGAGMLQRMFGSFLNDWLLKPPRCIRDEVEPGRVNEC
ncbi:MAG: SRPBCC family protein [Sandaracinaceae bacterium]